jgi:pimeloyl-ACP methyl ester carboxylesterase
MKTSVSYQTAQVNGFKIFYRQAGDPQAPALLLLHGFPTSSHMFRNLIPELADDYHIIAPDLPGFGFSDLPDHKSFAYTFDHLAEVIGQFTENIGLNKFAIYVFDYGAPVGFRLMLRYPDKITAIISQNGNLPVCADGRETHAAEIGAEIRSFLAGFRHTRDGRRARRAAQYIARYSEGPHRSDRNRHRG